MNVKYFLIFANILCFTSCAGDNVEDLVMGIIGAHCRHYLIYAYDDWLFMNVIKNWSAVLINLEKPLKVVGHLNMSEFILIQTKSLWKVEQFLKACRQNSHWDSSIKTLIVFGNSVVGVFSIVWNFHMVNVGVVLENANVYTYYPLSKGNCSYVGEEFAKHLFDEQVSKFRNCKFKTGYVNHQPLSLNWTASEPGAMLKISKELQKILGFELEAKKYTGDYGAKLQNGSYTNLLKDTYEIAVDFFSGNFANDTLFPDFDMYPVFLPANFYFWVARAEKESKWRNIMFTFSIKLWSLFISSYFLVSVIACLLSINETGKFKSRLYCILVVWRIIFTVQPAQPKTYQFKTLFVLWSFLVLLLASSFQVSLHATLFLTLRDNQIDSMEKLVNSSLGIGGSAILGNLFHQAKTGYSEIISARYETCPGLGEQCMDRVLDGNFATVRDLRLVNQKWKDYTDQDGNPRVYGIPNNKYVIPTITMRKGHVLFKTVCKTLLEFFEAHLIGKWDTYNYPPKIIKSKTSYMYLKMENLLVTFILLFIGLCVALVQFLYELI